MRAVLRAALGVLPTLLAVLAALAMFSGFLELHGVPATAALQLMVKGAFGSVFAFANTLQRAAPLMLTALCVVLPARAGLI
ncbi:MAG: ABC transporter permease, partial [Candidatus Macondimonas sp.]